MTDLGYCRLCAEIKNAATLIVINKNENDSTTTLRDKILQCFQIQILSDDVLPKTLCLDCCAQTNVTYEFYLKVQKAQEFLRNIVCNTAVSNRDSDFQYNSIQLVKINELTNESILQDYVCTDSQNKSKLSPKIEIAEFPSYDNSPSPTHNENIEVPETNSTLDDENGANSHIKREERQEEDSEVKLSKKIVGKDSAWNCTKCSNEFKTNNELVEHFQNQHAESPEYKCPKCSKVYEKYRLFSRHLQVHDNPDKFRCDICHKTFQYNSSLKRHLNVCHEQNRQLNKTCNICGKEFKSSSSFEYHTKYFHMSAEDKLRFERTDICKKRVTNKSSLVLHKKLHDETIDEPFDNENSLPEMPEHLNSIEDVQQPVLTTKNEQKITNNNKKDDSGAKSTKKGIDDVWKDIIWSCNKCNNEFETRKDLIYHYENFHSSPPEYKCPECSKCYIKYSLFRQHFGVHKNYQKFSCYICNKAFNSNSHLKGHLNIVHEQNPLAKKVCQICGKAFKSPTSLQYHMKYNHEPVDENSKYECDICKKKITTKSGLKTHRKTHDESTKTHMCDQCGTGFRLKSALRYHMDNVHGDIKEDNYLQCPLCPQKLKHKIQLQRHHRQIHTDKRFECETCGKKFSILTKYTVHLRLHTGEQPFECQYCNKRFRRKPALENHIRQHTGEKPYCCTDCKHYFTDLSNYIKHMRRKHGVTSFKNVKKLKT